MRTLLIIFVALVLAYSSPAVQPNHWFFDTNYTFNLPLAATNAPTKIKFDFILDGGKWVEKYETWIETAVMALIFGTVAVIIFRPKPKPNQ